MIAVVRRTIPTSSFCVNGSNQIFQSFGVMPGTSGTYSTSPASLDSVRLRRSCSARPAPSSFPPGVTELDFVDWPAAIGIDNLRIDLDTPITPQAVPEPASLVLLATGLLAVGYKASKSRRLIRGA